MMPTTFWEPHPHWRDGLEPHEGISAHDLARQEDGYWSEEDFFAYEPQIPAVPVKRWRGPQGTEHTDQAPHLMPFEEGDRVMYGFPGEIGVIVRPAHPLLGSYVVTRESNPVHQCDSRNRRRCTS